ncbi:MAG: DUF1549 and DUF1553 domain-containing protein [Gemmataceae bacterium]|nr:DUF1549 and DUF1553 domain-containing protein [Gemmataceae bacterium]
MFRTAIWVCGSALLVLAFAIPGGADQPTQANQVAMELLEGVADKRAWDFTSAQTTERYAEPAFGFTVLPRKFTAKGLMLDRSNPSVLRAMSRVTLPADTYRLLLRARGAARLFVDGRLVLQSEFIQRNANGNEPVPETPIAQEDGLRPLPVGHQEKTTTLALDAGPHDFRLEAFVGGQKVRPELGELSVSIAGRGQRLRLLSATQSIPLTDEGWTAYAAECRSRHQARDTAARKAITVNEVKYWATRHDLARRHWQQVPAVAVPRVSNQMPVHNDIDRFIGQRLEAKKVAPAPLCGDDAFLRRVTLDLVGVIPMPAEVEAFARDTSPDRRARVIDRLLADSRWADHWVGYWQDVLAENPGILKPTLNNTGPFRWWLHQAFLDNLPMDRFVTELILMEGSRMGGGPGGFALATQNDVPMAAKAHIVAKAFLGIEMGCARCHDAPFHPYKQKDLFSIAAMLGQGPQTVPATSSVRLAERARRSLIEVTLEPGSRVQPAWPFPSLAVAELPAGVLREPNHPRERLAAILTGPGNERFAQVFVNRLWKRYLGWGLVEPVDDWHNVEPSHPELLQYLARELITHDYDLKHVARLILSSHTYQRAVQPAGSRATEADERLFASPARRRLTAEQLVDSLFLAVGKEFQAEELTMDPEGRRPITEMINLGTPRRAWEFTSLSNERDRPALALPMAQSIVDLLVAFGWRDARQNPLTVRDETPTPLQPLILANGVVGSRITQLSDDSAITALCLEDRPLPDLIRAVFRHVLSRAPTAEEMAIFRDLLKDGYDTRRAPGVQNVAQRRPATVAGVSWSNHLSPEATRIKLELERAVRAGDPLTQRLRADWRERMEDLLWSLVNSPEFLFVP